MATTKKTPAKKSTTKKTTTKKSNDNLSDAEREALKERVAENRKAKGGKTDGSADVRAKIAEMSDADRAIAERIDEIVMATVPDVAPRTWYGMPAYAKGKGGKVVCFFQGADKFGARYATLGFNDPAQLDDGAIWPTAYAIVELGAEQEKQIVELVKRAFG